MLSNVNVTLHHFGGDKQAATTPFKPVRWKSTNPWRSGFLFFFIAYYCRWIPCFIGRFACVRYKDTETSIYIHINIITHACGRFFFLWVLSIVRNCHWLLFVFADHLNKIYHHNQFVCIFDDNRNFLLYLAFKIPLQFSFHLIVWQLAASFIIDIPFHNITFYITSILTLILSPFNMNLNKFLLHLIVLIFRRKKINIDKKIYLLHVLYWNFFLAYSI